jgi:glycosyltransferase involved in cell wall biosynthesis
VVKTEALHHPFFSIGVPTYNRHALLKQALESILSQEFEEFEVLVGNDYTEENLTCEMLGLSDSRIRIVNHSINMGEVGNMNALLGMARGSYFTWLFDDDLFEPGFLRIANELITAHDYPDAFFSSYRQITSSVAPVPFSVQLDDVHLFTGKEFLLRYSASKPDIISTCGFYRTEILYQSIRGFRSLRDSVFGLYSEYLLLVCCGLLNRIVFVNAPLVAFRVHPGSWGESNTELENYSKTGTELIDKSAKVLQDSQLTDAFRSVLLEMCKTHLFTYYHKSEQYELTCTKSKISRAVKYRLRYYKEVYRIWKLYATLTGLKHRECFSSFLHMLNHYHIFPPVWDV